MKSSFAALTLAAAIVPIHGGTIAAPHLAGSMNSWSATANPMTETGAGTDIWTTTISGLAASTRYEFKVTEPDWTVSTPGPNSWFYTDLTGSITVTYDGNTYSDGWVGTADRLGVSAEPGSWTAAGNWQAQVGGSDWDNANASTSMSPQGGGIYMFEATLAPGSYDWKAVSTGSWDSISSERSVNTPNVSFTTDAVNDTARMWVNTLSGTTRVEVIPEPSAALLGALGLLGILRRRR